MIDQVKNFVRDSLTADASSSDTTISVNNAGQFPDPSVENYNVVVWDQDTYNRPDEDSGVEVMRVTGQDTTNDTLTVTRGQESTSASSHPSGGAVMLGPTAKTFSDIESHDHTTADETKVPSGGLDTPYVDLTALFGSPVSAGGDSITNVGGTTDANSGEIRLPHGASIKARDLNDNFDIELLNLGNFGTDDISIGTNGNYDRVTIGDDSSNGVFILDFLQVFGDNGISITDASQDPTQNGQILRNGTDVKVYSGGSVRNMSNIGSGGGGGTSKTEAYYHGGLGL